MRWTGGDPPPMVTRAAQLSTIRLRLKQPSLIHRSMAEQALVIEETTDLIFRLPVDRLDRSRVNHRQRIHAFAAKRDIVITPPASIIRFETPVKFLPRWRGISRPSKLGPTAVRATKAAAQCISFAPKPQQQTKKIHLSLRMAPKFILPFLSSLGKNPII